jgi:predicted transcriptional regulator
LLTVEYSCDYINHPVIVAMATTLGVKVDEQLHERLKMMAELKDRSTHWVIKRAIEQYLEKEEARARDREEDRERWERYVLTGQAVPNEAATAWLDDLAAGRYAPWPQ